MMGVKTLLLVSLLAFLEMALGVDHHVPLPGAPVNISTDDRSLLPLVLAAAEYFNSQSNDAFFFKPSTIYSAKRQVVKGLRYVLDVQISRTVCRKRDHVDDLSGCDFQPEGHLHQTLQCHFKYWLVPWEDINQVQELTCKP